LVVALSNIFGKHRRLLEPVHQVVHGDGHFADFVVAEILSLLFHEFAAAQLHYDILQEVDGHRDGSHQEVRTQHPQTDKPGGKEPRNVTQAANGADQRRIRLSRYRVLCCSNTGKYFYDLVRLRDNLIGHHVFSQKFGDGVLVVVERYKLFHNAFFLHLQYGIELEENGVHQHPLTVAFPSRHKVFYRCGKLGILVVSQIAERLFVFFVALQVHPVGGQHFGARHEKDKVVYGVLRRTYGIRRMRHYVLNSSSRKENDGDVNDVQDHQRRKARQYLVADRQAHA